VSKAAFLNFGRNRFFVESYLCDYVNHILPEHIGEWVKQKKRHYIVPHFQAV
jgi:hypothetical protein